MRQKLITGIIILCLLCSLGFMHNYYSNQIEKVQTELVISQQNYKAEADSLRNNIKTKDGEIVYAQSMYYKEIGDLNSKLNNLTLDNKKLKLKIKDLIEFNSQLQHDTLITKTDTILIHDSISSIYFNYKDRWTELDGITKYNFKDNNSSTIINNLTINTPLNVGISEDNQVLITSPNPNLNITNIYGVTTFEKKKHKIEFNHGLQLGVGLQYGIISNGFDVGPSVNYGIEIWF